MRAAGIGEFGGAVGGIDLPDPRPLANDEALIEIRAAGVGNWEEFVRTGQWDVGRTPPMALGVEAAGTITAIGDSVEDWEPGDEVLSHPLPLRDQGTWAPLLIASATVLARKPASLSWEAAAAFPVPALTATQVIDGALAVRPDDLVLVNGGSGVTGTLLVGLAAARGAEVITTAGPASHERLRRLGAAHVLDYHDPDWPVQARAIGGGLGVTAVANAVPKEVLLSVPGIGLSIGIGTIPPASDARMLVDQADSAMYEAKAAGGGVGVWHDGTPAAPMPIRRRRTLPAPYLVDPARLARAVVHPDAVVLIGRVLGIADNEREGSGVR